MMDNEKLEDLKHFVELCKENPSILLNPSLTFFKNFLESLGAQVPSSVKSEQVGEEHDDELDEDIIESDVELDNTDIVEPDNDPPQQMGDPSSEVTDENRDAAQISKAKALNAISEGKLNEAIDHLTEAILLNPNSAILYATRANVFIKLKKPNAAIRDADAALKVNPDSAKGYKVRGMARAMLGLWKEAASDLRVASMIDFDEEIAEILKKVEPNAHKIEEHCRKYQRLREEKKLRKIKRDTQQRQAELKAVYEKSKKKEQQSKHEASDPDSASDLNDGAKDTLTTEGNNAASDTGSAFYLHPSDSPGMMLVPVHFDGTGYQSWKSEVMQALSVKNKLGFIDRSCGKPDANSPQFRQWKMCDDMVTSWILNSMTKEISDSVEYVNDSAGLWKVLEDRYDQINGAKIYQIQKEINNLTQGNLDITVYYARMNELWEELSSLNLSRWCNCECICGAKDSMHKAEQDRHLIQFLVGLNEEYSVVRGNILAMNPLPSVAQAFSLLIKENEQKDPDSASASASELNDGNVVDIHSVSELETKLNAASKASCLAILYFTATWCGPCHYVSPFYSSLPGKYPKVAFLKADIDEARDVASRWNVSGIPSFFFIKNGKEVDMVVGADRNLLEKKIAQYAG